MARFKLVTYGNKMKYLCFVLLFIFSLFSVGTALFPVCITLFPVGTVHLAVCIVHPVVLPFVDQLAGLSPIRQNVYVIDCKQSDRDNAWKFQPIEHNEYEVKLQV